MHETVAVPLLAKLLRLLGWQVSPDGTVSVKATVLVRP